MSQIMKTFLGLFLILFMTAAGTGILSVFLSVTEAQSFYYMVLDELENSNYAQPVLEECLREADQKGYELVMTIYLEDGSSVSCSRVGEESAAYTDEENAIRLIRVSLTYSYHLVFLNVGRTGQLAGYA